MREEGLKMSEIATAKAGTIEQAHRPFRFGLALWAMAAAALGAGLYWFGAAATLDVSSPEFFPLPGFFAFAFALFGTIHFGQGLLAIRRHSKYGASILEANQAVLGQVFRGSIRTDRALEVSGPYTIRLLCETQAPADSDGDTRGRQGRTPLWEATVSAPASTRSSTGIPFRFKIPEDALPNKLGSTVPGHAIFWTLSVSAPMAGLHYNAAFPIDVSATEDETEDDEPKGPPSLKAAFVGQARPETAKSRVLRFIVPIVGILLFATGAYTTAKQVSHGRNGVALKGRITAVDRPALEVALDRGGAVRIAQVTKNNIWLVGQAVDITCLPDGGGWRSCRMDTAYDRWIDAVGTLAFGAVLLLFAGWLWTRRRG
jgi:hypothetical protein